MAAAVAAAQVEAVAPLQQQLEELSQQLQNSQVGKGRQLGPGLRTIQPQTW